MLLLLAGVTANYRYDMSVTAHDESDVTKVTQYTTHTLSKRVTRRRRRTRAAGQARGFGLISEGRCELDVTDLVLHT